MVALAEVDGGEHIARVVEVVIRGVLGVPVAEARVVAVRHQEPEEVIGVAAEAAAATWESAWVATVTVG